MENQAAVHVMQAKRNLNKPVEDLALRKEPPPAIVRDKVRGRER